MKTLKVAVMQPYFFPYIGYFHLIKAVDLFIVYDDIKYTKKGWINRNRILRDGAAAMFTLPLKADSDSLDICRRALATDFTGEKLLRQLTGTYRRAPYFDDAMALVHRLLDHEDRNLFGFLHHSIVETCRYLGLNTEIRISSELGIDRNLAGQDKVLALCQAVGATTYVNAIGGTELYSAADFSAQGIDLKFVKSRPCEYHQFGDVFVPWLSIVDVIMFNPKATVAAMLDGYDLT